MDSGKLSVIAQQLVDGKPPLCKGRCQPNRLTEGLKKKVSTTLMYWDLRMYVFGEEQRAMPIYEEPPVLPGVSFYSGNRLQPAAGVKE